jgi:uncharacterized membrane protein
MSVSSYGSRTRQTRPAKAAGRSIRPLSLIGSASAILFFCLSLTPSLLPRSWYLQGAVGGITAAMGYTLGATIRWRPARGWIVLAVAAPPPLVAFLLLGNRWQGDLRRRLGVSPPDTYYTTRMVVIGVLVFGILLLIARGLRLATSALIRLLRRIAPAPVAACSGVLVVAVLATTAVDGLVVDNIVAATDRQALAFNESINRNVVVPVSSLRSGGPYSWVAWPTLGRRGRDFVARGPSRAQLAAFAGRPAIEPIRLYAGLASAATATDRAGLVLREMDRTGAFDRAVIAVVIPTGTGWVDSAVTNSLEYMYAGDTAMVSMQYSYLPSWASFVVETDTVIDAAVALITAVRDRWSALPPVTRPKLLIFGESLGSLGTEKAFGSVAGLVSGADGILLEGPTFANPLRNEIIAARRPGTPIWDPAYGPEPVEFASRPAELRDPVWPRPRVVYLQNSSDPVVWWSPDLLYRSPEWLRHPRGPDISPHMHWYPGVTFWQATVDLLFANQVPTGHGHVYRTGVVDGWAVLARPPGWTAADTVRLRTHLGG